MLLPRRRMGRSLLFPLLLWAAPPLPGANVFSLPSITLPEGAEGQELFLHCEHDELLTGFSVAIRYDFSKIAITDVTTSGTNAKNAEFVTGTNQNGQLIYGVVMEISETSFGFLPPSADDTLLRFTADVLAAAPATAALDFVDGLNGGNFPIKNLITTDRGISVSPALVSGSITVSPPSESLPPVADAGPDQIVPEVSSVVLDASGSSSPQGRALSFHWKQISPVPGDVPGGDAKRVSLDVPPVDGDQSLLFEVTVSDGVSSATDRTTVFVADLDLRKGKFEQTAQEAVLLPGGAQAVLFKGKITWNSDQANTPEEVLWTRMRFTAAGAGDESKLLSGTALYLDSDNDGSFDPEKDRQLGQKVALESDNASVSFSFGETLSPDSQVGFFLVVDLASHVKSSRAWVVFPWALVAAGLWSLRGRNGRRVLGLSGLPIISLLGISLILVLPLGAACGGSGGGGRKSGARGGEVRFDLKRPDDIGLQGKSTGISAVIEGLPVRGAPLDLFP